jgi:hypothetical protein
LGNPAFSSGVTPADKARVGSLALSHTLCQTASAHKNLGFYYHCSCTDCFINIFWFFSYCHSLSQSVTATMNCNHDDSRWSHPREEGSVGEGRTLRGGYFSSETTIASYEAPLLQGCQWHAVGPLSPVQVGDIY